MKKFELCCTHHPNRKHKTGSYLWDQQTDIRCVLQNILILVQKLLMVNF